MVAIRIPQRRGARLSRSSLLAQVLAVNAALLTGAVFAASVAAQLDLSVSSDLRRFGILTVAILTAVLVNGFVLRRRFEPLERMIDTMEKVASDPRTRPTLPDARTDEIVRLYESFERMLDRLDEERARTAAAVLRAQEEERTRIARDLHDEANQALTAVLLRLQATAQNAPDALRDELLETQAVADQAIRELLRLARELRPAALDDLGLAAALRSKASDFARQSGTRMNVDIDAHAADTLSAERQIVVYRVVQESLSNVAQHAGAANVVVRLQREEGAVVVEITDDGAGFSGEDAAGRHGLLGMRERAVLAGGRLEIQSAIGAGTTIHLRLADQR
ncbi:unannotated protein [freshwater metagenome]|uniref:histidine kinase n=1 Tax=freshwater metagenome TaxID=449393 RepID=A0A6J7DLB4_9ZZZZ|nr:HAMP domain-containing protein [Actinomycetota bacterium]